MTETTAAQLSRPPVDTSISNTDIVLVVLADLGGRDRPIDVEDIAEAAWQAVPRRFSWPRHQQYPDLDAVDVTLRAAKKNEGLVTGSKREGWMLSATGVDLASTREGAVRAFVDRHGRAGRTDNRRERGGMESAAQRRLEQLRGSDAAQKHGAGLLPDITVYDFMAFFNVNQYMPDRKYTSNHQAVVNLVRDEPQLLATATYLHKTFAHDYKARLQGKGTSDVS
jgi:hypothetical protein